MIADICKLDWFQAVCWWPSIEKNEETFCILNCFLTSRRSPTNQTQFLYIIVEVSKWTFSYFFSIATSNNAFLTYFCKCENIFLIFQLNICARNKFCDCKTQIWTTFSYKLQILYCNVVYWCEKQANY